MRDKDQDQRPKTKDQRPRPKTKDQRPRPKTKDQRPRPRSETQDKTKYDKDKKNTLTSEKLDDDVMGRHTDLRKEELSHT